MIDETRRSPKPIDDMMFDRLVDNEMTEKERRDLLLLLDSEPDGWRRLALAFLEAQMWQEAMELPMPAVEEGPAVPATSPSETADDPQVEIEADVEETTTSEVEGIAQTPADKPRPFHRSLRSRWAHRAQTVAAMAASFLIALGIGSFWNQRGLPVPGGPTDQPGVESSDPSGAPTTGDQMASTDPSSHSTGKQPWQLVEMSGPVGPGGTNRTVYLPAVERPGIDEEWVQSLPPTVPDDVRQSLYRTGHQISEQRELVPIMTDDGRQVVVPIDRVNVRYVGRDSL